MILMTLLTIVQRTDDFLYDFQLLHNQILYNLKINYFFKRNHELPVPILENILTLYANFERSIGYKDYLFEYIYKYMMGFYKLHMDEVRQHKEKYVV